jgi:hypothetical protein
MHQLLNFCCLNPREIQSLLVQIVHFVVASKTWFLVNHQQIKWLPPSKWSHNIPITTPAYSVFETPINPITSHLNPIESHQIPIKTHLNPYKIPIKSLKVPQVSPGGFLPREICRRASTALASASWDARDFSRRTSSSCWLSSSAAFPSQVDGIYIGFRWPNLELKRLKHHFYWDLSLELSSDLYISCDLFSD